MGKLIEKKTVKNKKHNGDVKEKRRNIKREPRSHWKFKNRRNTRKFEKKQKKVIEEQKKNSIQKQEEEIEIIEKENELFDDKGYYNPKPADDAPLEWDNEDDNNNNIPQIDSLMNKMNEVNEKKLDPVVIKAYRILSEILRDYTSGKMPKAFNILPATENWQELIDLTEPYNWSPQAMHQATILFSSGFNPALAEIFYEKYLLPAIRNDIKRNKKLNIHYYNCLKKSLFKPAAFFKGLIFPLSKSLSEREATIIGSIIRRCSIPMVHAGAAMMKLIDLCKEGRNGLSVGAVYFLRLLMLKKYSLPDPVKQAIVNMLCHYEQYKHKLPVIWFQFFLLFVQMYKTGLTEQEKDKLRNLNNKLQHHAISPEISKELNYNPQQAHTSKSNNMQMEIE